MVNEFEFIEHTADIKFRAYGKSLNEAFENAALAVSDYLSRGERIKEKKNRIVKVKGSDVNSLFYNFLEEIIYLLDVENFVVARANVNIKNNKLIAKFFGDDAKNYNLDHIKAATYSEMYVKKTKKGFILQAVMDV